MKMRIRPFLRPNCLAAYRGPAELFRIMKAFDYKVITVEAPSNHQIEADLNALGEHGWELVGYSEPGPNKIRFILKKPAAVPAPPPVSQV
jgi:hypothetical protein